MFFSNDASDFSKIWIDRNGEGLVEHFAPCNPCRERTAMQSGPEEWTPLHLCVPCRTDLALMVWLNDTLDVERPFRVNPLPSQLSQPVDRYDPDEHLLW